AQPLWERYFQRLVDQARARLRATPRRVADEEDVALSVFDSFCRGAERGRFPQLSDRDDLWRLLVVITRRKTCHPIRDRQRLRRGGPAADAPRPGREDVGRDDVVGAEPTPEFAAHVAEETERLLRVLDQTGDATLRINALCDRFEAEWQAGRRPRLDD